MIKRKMARLVFLLKIDRVDGRIQVYRSCNNLRLQCLNLKIECNFATSVAFFDNDEREQLLIQVESDD